LEEQISINRSKLRRIISEEQGHKEIDLQPRERNGPKKKVGTVASGIESSVPRGKPPLIRTFNPSPDQLTHLWWRAYSKIQAETPGAILLLEASLQHIGAWPEQANSDKSWALKAAKLLDKIVSTGQDSSADATQIFDVLKIIKNSLSFETAAIAWTTICLVTIVRKYLRLGYQLLIM
jgi:hypothetical protein